MGEETIKIGELLVRAGVLTEGKLNQRLDLARQLGLPVGQIFIQSADMNREQLLNAIHVQSLVLESLVTLSTAVDVVRDMFRKNISLEQSLAQNGLADQHLTHRLGELLVHSGYLTDDDLAGALLTSGEIGVPLGHVLIQTGAVPPDIVGIALTTQRQIRMRIMTMDQAVTRLKTYHPSPSAPTSASS